MWCLYQFPISTHRRAHLIFLSSTNSFISIWIGFPCFFKTPSMRTRPYCNCTASQDPCRICLLFHIVIAVDLGVIIAVESKPIGVTDFEFPVLILHICSYATQFLPLLTPTIDQICGRPLSEIRNTCSDVGQNPAKLCGRFDWKGSISRISRVLHIIFAVLKVSCEGRTDQFWEYVALASRAAPNAGIHTHCIHRTPGFPERQCSGVR